MSCSEKAPDVVIRLTRDEAVILFDLLARWTTDRAGATPPADCFESPSECAVLHGVLCGLEAQLPEPLSPDHERTLAEARQRLAGGWNGTTLRE